MFPFVAVAVLSLIPLSAFLLAWRYSEKSSARLRGGRLLALFGVGVLSAAPFLTSRGVGTGEAYNYSLAVADAVTQMRAGEFPPLAGQTEFAFNGRVHPLRNAPYLFFLAGALDLATLRHLTFWQLQNFTLAFSLVALVFTCYGGLRWGTGCAPPLALGLAAFYGFSPAVLSACTVNLFMTVHVAVFAPIAIAACLRHCREFSIVNDVVLAAALAAAWLAHPPVAMWLTAGVGLVRLLILGRNPSWQARLGLMISTLFGLALAGFVFVSVLTLSSDLGYFPEGEDVETNYLSAVMANIHAAFPGTVLPVSPRADLLTDLQFGYAGFFLLALTLVGLVGLAREPGESARVRRVSGVSLVAVALGLLALVLPVPHLTPWLWQQVPIAAKTLTTVWPMQRVYLVVTALTIFAAALVLPRAWPALKRPRRAIALLAVLATGWTLWEAGMFLRRGFELNWTADATRRSHLASNLYLTVTSYAFLGTPRTFVDGVMDPQFEFRLIKKKGGQEIDSPLKAALAKSAVVARGEIFRHAQPDTGLQTEVRGGKFLLQPGQRYLLTFNFLTPALPGQVLVDGPGLARHYTLPADGEAEGFGMGPGHSHSISLWTSLSQPEEVTLRFLVQTWPAGIAEGTKISDFTLQAVDRAQLPVRVDSLLPLRAVVDASEADLFLTTPRRYIPGYTVTVNGRSLHPSASPDGQVMVAVPRGRSVVELRYEGPRALRIAFWTSAASWLGLLIWAAGNFAGVEWRIVVRRSARLTVPVFSVLFRFKSWLLVALLAASVILFVVTRRENYAKDFGPIHLRVIFPRKQIGRQQPLLVTGRTGAGTNVFVDYLDDDHVRIGADIWGGLYQSDPIPVDYFQVQDLIVNSSALYPLDHPLAKTVDPHLLQQLRDDFSVEFNGRQVIHQKRSAYESTVAQVTVGETRIGGSLTQPKFTGEIVQVERLPWHQPLVLAQDENLRVHLRFPTDRKGVTETLVSFGRNGEDGAITLSYESKDFAVLAHRSAGGDINESVNLTYQPKQTHEFEFQFGPAATDSTASPHAVSVAATFDGKQVLGSKPLSSRRQPLVTLVGFAQADVLGVDARFTGTELFAEAVLNHPVESTGALRLVVTLPKDKIGRPEPLLTTGRTGKGDFAYIVYLDAKHVRFGLDHWAVGGALSDPVEIDYEVPHEIEIRLSSLYPPESDPAWKGVTPTVRQQLLSQMEILLDGHRVLNAPFVAHPTAPAEITIGENRIGGSNCDPNFTGEINGTLRAGLPR